MECKPSCFIVLLNNNIIVVVALLVVSSSFCNTLFGVFKPLLCILEMRNGSTV